MAIRFVILDELEIPYEDIWDTNPTELMQRAHKKADELKLLLDKPDTLSDIESRFRDSALKNEAAKERAREILDTLNNVLLGESAEVLANFIAMLPETTSLANSIVQSMGVQVGSLDMPKPIVAKLYANLRAWQEAYIKLGTSEIFQMVKNMPPKEKISMIPGKPGNYAPKKGGQKLYHFKVSGVDFYSPYAVIKELNLTAALPVGARFFDVINVLLNYDGDDLEIQEF